MRRTDTAGGERGDSLARPTTRPPRRGSIADGRTIHDPQEEASVLPNVSDHDHAAHTHAAGGSTVARADAHRLQVERVRASLLLGCRSSEKPPNGVTGP
jgi:hypothetical protein